MKIFLAWIVAVWCLLFGAQAQAASFDCGKATTEVEKLICADEWASRNDEELARVYAEALAKSTEPEKLKAGQKAWLKERNRCSSAGCISGITRYRIEQLQMLTAKLGQSGAAATGKLSFQFCENRPSLMCQHPGRGYSVCEAYLKHLNAMPADWKHGACVPWVDPSRGDFTRPDWQPLDVRAHLPWIYEMTRYISPSDAKLPSFEEWRGLYEARIERGEISPVLKRVRLEIIKGAGLETLFSYNDGDPVMSGCRDGVPVGSGGSTREAIFLLQDEARTPSIKEIGGFYTFADMLLFRGQPVFLAQHGYHKAGVGWYVTILFPVPHPNDPKDYYKTQRCEFIDTLYGRRQSK